MPKKPRICQRCFCKADQLYEAYREDADGTKKKIYVCWGCDWELMNGYPMDEDAGEIHMRRQEEEYEADPINNSPPPWYNRT